MYAEKEPQRSKKRPPVVQQHKNKTGLPDQLKTGMESLSGMNLDHVRVHYNSPKPAAVQAHAYAQGSDIHLAPGQAKHLPHELGHVVQQAQGRVKPTTSVNGMAVNDSTSLEKEADRMGASAMQMRVKQGFGFVDNRPENIVQRVQGEHGANALVIQRGKSDTLKLPPVKGATPIPKGAKEKIIKEKDKKKQEEKKLNKNAKLLKEYKELRDQKVKCHSSINRKLSLKLSTADGAVNSGAASISDTQIENVKAMINELKSWTANTYSKGGGSPK